MHDELQPALTAMSASVHELPPYPDSEPPATDSTVRGMLQEAIQKVMDEIEHHEQEARRHLQLAEDLRKELQEGFRLARQEARAKTALAPRTAPADGNSAPVEAIEETAGTRPPRADAKKKTGSRKGRKRQ